MNSKTTITLSTMAIAAVVLLFASGPVVGSQQALAFGWGGGGWGWHQTKMVDPERAERLWLAIAVATLWAVSVGGEVDANLPVSSLEALPESHVARRTATKRSRPRLVSCFARGIVTIVGRLIRGDGLVVGRFVPEPWPSMPSVPKKKTTKTKAHVPQEAA